MDEHLVIVGASARAAAWSALRAGLRPWCVDLFADADLAAMCPARKLEGRYPHGFAAVLAEAPPGPWMYTGGLENYPRLVSRMARQRPLWGNDGAVLRRARDPDELAKAAREAGLPAPALGGGRGRWLVKPRRGAGGAGIHFWSGEPVTDNCYLQEHIEGEPASAAFAGGALLGVTRQLVGEAWLGAAPFHYCGSVGPVEAPPGVQALGEVLVDRLGLRGLFGVDGILRDGEFWPVELNPRYTASVEVIERARGVRALALYSANMAGRALLLPPLSPEYRGEGPGVRGLDARPAPSPLTPLPLSTGGEGDRSVAKGILYARADVTFPADGPWRYGGFADLPRPGDLIQAGHPILTMFAPGLEALRRRAAEVEALLYAGR